MAYADFEDLLSVAVLVTAMLGMGATLTVADFVKVARVPQAMALMYLVQVVISPLVALAIARVLRLPPGVTIGLLLVAALPGGLFSNIITYFGRGNVALSVSATALASLTCLVTTSLVLRVVGRTDLPDNFHMPTGSILFEIGMCMILPLIVGMVVRRFAARHHAMIARIFLRLSLVVLVVFIVAAIGAGHIRAVEYGWRPPLALFVFAYACLWLCYGLGIPLRLSLNDRFTIGMECVVRNVQLGVLLKATLFPPGATDQIGDGVLYVLLFYGGLCLCLAGIESVCKRMEIGTVFGAAKNKTAAQPRPAETPTAETTIAKTTIAENIE